MACKHDKDKKYVIDELKDGSFRQFMLCRSCGELLEQQRAVVEED